MDENTKTVESTVTTTVQRTRVFYSNHRALLLSGLTVLSILLIVWARLGFTFQLSRFYAADYGSCSASVINTTAECLPGCTASQHPGSTTPDTLGCTSGGTCCVNKPLAMSVATWNVADGRWFVAGRYDPTCPATFPYQTERTKPDGSPFSTTQGCVEKPQDCPDGYHAVGATVCSNVIATPVPTPIVTPVLTPTPTPVSTPTPTGVPVSTPLVTINPVPATLNGVALGTVSGSATDTVGVQKIIFVIRRNLSSTGTCIAGTQDWNGSSWVPGCQIAGQIYPSITPGTSVQWSVANTPPLSQMTPGTYRIYAAAFRSESPLVWSTYSTKDVLFVAPTPTPSAINIPPPTPSPTSVLPASFFFGLSGRNVTTASAPGAVVQAQGNQLVEVIMLVSNKPPNNAAAQTPISNVMVRATLPAGLAYVPGSTSVGGAPSAVETITTGGLSLGTINSQQEVGVAFRARVVTSSFAVGTTQVEIAANASSDNATLQSDVVTVVVTRAAVTVPGTVPTGPADAVLVALLVSTIMTLLYVSYSHTSAYKRKEIESITKTRDPMDFRS